MLRLLWYSVIAFELCMLRRVSPQTLYNSTLACTRGADQTYVTVDCTDIYPDGRARALSFFRVFFGATPSSSGCNRTAPYANCCGRDASRPDCTFSVDAELQEVIDRCSGTSFCSFPGKRISTSLGNCDQNIYPNLTSFSFVEYNCTDQIVTSTTTTVKTTTVRTTTPSASTRGVIIAPTAGTAFNSSLACTRGADQTYHDLDCRRNYQDGSNRSLSILRVFYGATPLSSGCDRTAPSANCCVRDPNKVDCVFQNDGQLQDIIEKCSGASYCAFPGLRVSSSLGNCDPNNYPTLTSFSFIEYLCLPRRVTGQVCTDHIDQQIGDVYLESNTVLVGGTVNNAICQCIITTDCDSILSFYGIIVQLTDINTTACAEEITFADVTYPQFTARVNCTNDDNVLYNQSLFTSLSNVASFQFRVTGQQLGKIYIRAQSSVSTANVTLTCGDTPVVQALNQIQLCPNRTTTTPPTTPTTTTVTVPVEGPIFNSSLACTRGANQTYHSLDCRDHYQDGGNRSLSILRVFYGATPLSSGCDRTVPYANCCVRDPNKVDCVFQNDGQLQEIIEKCSGVSYCAFPGLRVSSSLGNCDPNNYPTLTSFSFIEFQCLAPQVTGQVCSDHIDKQIGEVFLESNTVLVGKTVTNAICQCLITTDCDAILSFYGIIVQLTDINTTACAEEITFADVHYPQLTARVNCTNDDNVLYNQSLFTSLSNVASFQFRVTGQQLGKIYIRAQSSLSTANVTLTCGDTPVIQALNQLQQCPNRTTTTPSTTPTTTTVAVPVEGPIFNSSLACTRGANQTYHSLDCRDHYQDGGNRSLSILRVFYGATPLSSGCDRTAPYAYCCVRDPNKVDCVFQNDGQLQEIIEKCSGVSYCAFPGLRVSSSLGNCDPNNYPTLTSFSFIEFQCLAPQVTGQVCSDHIDKQIGEVFLESNTVLVGKTVTNAICQCLITTDCDAILSFYGIIVQLTDISTTACAEEITFADVNYPQLTARVNCTNDDNVLYNQSLFTSLSNVASFQFRVTGQQLGKIYIRAQSSLSTANVTLTCGDTPVIQALNQLQQCPNRTTTTPSTTPTTTTVAVPVEGPIFNSSLACTRGANQTYHSLDCRDHYQDGGNRSLSILRVFYGATHLSSGCDRTAPYANCCVRDPNKVDCVFQNDGQLQEIIEKCSGVSYCAFPGLRVSSSLGNCDPNNYPTLTSFSFIEFKCLAPQVTGQVCSDHIDKQIGEVFLESNTVLVGKTVTNAICQCLITTDCDAILSFYGIVVQLTDINTTACAEEITFADVHYPQFTARVNCTNDDNVLYNQSLFTSLSNVASFQFRVTGQQLGKIYIRAQSSLSTANVTLTCGDTPVIQALNQIQQCPNRTTTTPSTTPTTTTVAVPVEGPIFNSSLACTRGANQTYHSLDCRDHYQDGGNRSLSILRVFYGATPLSSGCDRTAPYANCCVRDPNKVDCVFQNDGQLQEIIEKCSGVSYCAFPGLRVSSSLGNCDPNNYPTLTSFSFIEFKCLAPQVTGQVCSDHIDKQIGEVFLESNTVLVGKTVTNAICQCLITTDCDAILSFYGIVVQLTDINTTACAEEITFADVHYPQFTARVNCTNDDNVLYNQSLFTSLSNVASFQFRVTGQQLGKIYIRAQSSLSTANVTLTCGDTPVIQALNQIQQCPNRTTTTPSTTPTTTTVAVPVEGPIFNSSLACTRGANQTYHSLDCRDHYQDGGNRSLSILRVFYGATPLSSGCDRTAPYANCCVRDPNKVDCVFQNDGQLQEIIGKCSGVSYCAFPGLRVSSSLGNCDPNNYPTLTSFSFIEFQCLAPQVTGQVCTDHIDKQIGEVFLESNTVLVGKTVTNATCQCLITTDCDAILSFYGIIVQLTDINTTACAEEITFADVHYPQFTARVNCTNDDNVLYNQSLFTSLSNVASFQFRVTGQQLGKIYIRAQSSVSTANVTLTCGDTPVVQALNQIQLCPNRTTTTPSTTPTTTTVTVPVEGPIFNSSLACTRGANQTYNSLDCRDHYQDGGNRSLSILRVFYGATPLSSGCDRTAPYANCCVRDPNKVDCVFQNDGQLQEIIEKCSGVSYCAFPGLRVSSSLGNCDPNNYPTLTSFSFIEFQCLAPQVTGQVCTDHIDKQIGEVFLESNTVLVGKTVTNATCQCLITTDCDAILSFYGIIVQLTDINTTACAEEITFADVHYPQFTARVNCTNDDNVLYNQSLFTSLSNVASFQFRVTGQQLGKIYIRAQSSVSTANVTLTCGDTPVVQALNQIQLCPNRTTTTPSTTPTTTTVTVPVEGPIFNSSLACTRGANQTYHSLDCRDHYQDGGNRSLSILRVFYGATPLSSGCDRTAPYANCCVRDPNKVDCVFQNDGQLQEIIEKCSGVSYCAFPGLRVSSSLGNCDPNNYPTLTSFSFIEFQCLAPQVTGQVCTDHIDKQIGEVFLESNTVLVGKTVTNAICQCLITTDCDAILSFYGIIVQLTDINTTACAEEITFADVHYPQFTARVNCTNDDNVLYNQSLFTSLSNVASFHFRVTGQQLGKIYIRAQSSLSTANVTLTCGDTPVIQALNQIQQCPNRTTTTPSTTPTTTTVAVPVEGPIFNSSLACTRGADQTYHSLDCRDHYQDGGSRSLSILRVFYGATPLSSGCDRTAPYANCCVRDPNMVDCVFQNDGQLQEIIEKCSGVSYCAFPGLRVSSSLGNCDPNNYPTLTSFSFIEFQCLAPQVTGQVCSDHIDKQIGEVFLESNTVLVGKTVTNATCQCLITTDCDAILNFYGIIVQLTDINTTACAEEITFADVHYPQFTARVNCTNDDNVLYNQSLFTSLSNVASFQFHVTGQQLGKIYIRAQSSVGTANVTLTCGTPAVQALNQLQLCPNRTTTTPSTTPTTTTVTVPVEGPIFNSSLACTRGADQTYHSLDCRRHYQDGANRSLSILRVFYGATPISGGCNRTAPYANCCVRDPNKMDCVFQNDIQLQDIIEKCSGASYCVFPGIIVPSSLGNCDPNNYSSLTSFSFIEYLCLPRRVTGQVCSDHIDKQIGEIYLESNTVLVDRPVTNTVCQCLITTDCDAILSFYGIIVQLTDINTTTCAEEIIFADVHYPQLTARVNCTNDDNVLYNQSLFTSLSNVASFQFRVTGQQLGKIYIRAQSSIPTANVTLTCGDTPVVQALNQLQLCLNRTTTTSSPDTTTKLEYITSPSTTLSMMTTLPSTTTASPTTTTTLPSTASTPPPTTTTLPSTTSTSPPMTTTLPSTTSASPTTTTTLPLTTSTSPRTTTLPSTTSTSPTTTTTLPTTTPTTQYPSTVTVPVEGTIFNSTLACTRDGNNHVLDCRDHYQDGGSRVLFIRRVFYGATPLSSECNRTAPSANCCVRDPNKMDCVFQNDGQLQEIIQKCSGVSYCAVPGLTVSPSLGNCDSSSYPNITSFSFIEYQCLSPQITGQTIASTGTLTTPRVPETMSTTTTPIDVTPVSTTSGPSDGSVSRVESLRHFDAGSIVGIVFGVLGATLLIFIAIILFTKYNKNCRTSSADSDIAIMPDGSLGTPKSRL